MSEPSSKPNGRKSTPLRVEDFKELMTKEEMEAFAAACRIKFGTAQAVDYVIVARYERMLSAKQRDDPAGSN